METLPFYLSLVFGLTVLSTVFGFYVAAGKSKPFLLIAFGFIAFQSALGLSGFYQITNSTPPRFPLLIIPTIFAIFILFFTIKGRTFLDVLDLKGLTLLHLIRIPVEVVLFSLFIHKAIPEIMTFEGRNPDILSGITAPVVYFLGFRNKKIYKPILLIWNFLTLGLLFNIVFHAILSAPSVFQQFGFDQPNIAIFYFPFVLLPSVVVPLVLLSHLATIWKLLKVRVG